MRTLGLFCSLTFLGGAVSAGAAESTLPSRPVLPPETGVAPRPRIPDASTVSPLPEGTIVPMASVPRAVRRAVVADAAKRFKVAESAVVLVRAEQVTWSDGSIGCSEPGGIYTQNPVPGFLIVAKTGAGELTYHTDSRTVARSCGTGRPTSARKMSEKAAVRGAPPATDR